MQKLNHQSGVCWSRSATPYKDTSQVYADQSPQEYEHAEKAKDFSHANSYCWVNYNRLVRVHDTLRHHGEAGRGLRSNNHLLARVINERKAQRHASKDDVGSLGGVLATSSRLCKTQAAEEGVPSHLCCEIQIKSYHTSVHPLVPAASFD